MVAQEKSIETQFFQWLSLKVSPAQLSEIYNVKGKADAILMKSKTLRHPLMQTFDVEQLRTTQQKLKAVFANKARRNKVAGLLRYYIDFLKENLDIHTEPKQVTKGPVVSAASTAVHQKTQADVTPMMPDDRKEEVVKAGRIAFIDWMKTSGLKTTTIFSYLSAIGQCSKFALEHRMLNQDIYLISDFTQLVSLSNTLLQNDEFVQWNARQHNRFSAALAKYVEYKHSGYTTTLPTIAQPAVQPEQHENKPSFSTEMERRYKIILNENFKNGFRPNRAIDIDKFKMYYSNFFGCDPAENDDCIVSVMEKIGTTREGRIYAKKDDRQNHLIQEIQSAIKQAFVEGASCIYVDAIFERYQAELSDDLQIYNVDSLTEMLIASANGAYQSRCSYLYIFNREPDLQKDVFGIIKASQVPLSYDELKTKLWYIPLDKIKNVLVTNKSLVNVASETYFYAPNLPVSATELKTIIDLIQNALSHKNYVTGTELMELLKRDCPSVLINTEGYPVWGLRNALGYLLRDHFSFNGPIISGLGREVNKNQVFAEYCQDHASVTLEDIKQLAADMNSTIYWDAVYSEMIRISRNEFVRKDQLHFDVDRVDNVLEQICSEAYLPIKRINLFLQFPPMKVRWNSYVLESFVYSYSKKFRLIHACFTATDCFGAVVRRDSGIDDYSELLTDILAHSNEWHNKQTALQFIVDEGYQLRRTYSGIEQIVRKAKLRREYLAKSQN